MVRTALLAVIVVGSLGGLGGLLTLKNESRSADLAAEARPVASWHDQVVADGVVEGATPEVALRPEVAGMLAAVHVREDQEVTRGTLLAELKNESQAYQVSLAAAEVAIAQGELDRLRNGERVERRKVLAANEQVKIVQYRQAKDAAERSRRLFERQAGSQEQRDQDLLVLAEAQAEWDAAAAERALGEAPARADEVAVAEFRVAAAEAKRRLAESELAKTRLLAPADGRVLRVMTEPGEAAGPAMPQPVLLLADLSRRRIRAYVEELDAARVRIGQPATVTADGLPGRHFAGTVAQVAPRMGKRTLFSDDPGEYKDLYFREVLIDLDGGDELPLNLRVQARIQATDTEGAR